MTLNKIQTLIITWYNKSRRDNTICPMGTMEEIILFKKTDLQYLSTYVCDFMMFDYADHRRYDTSRINAIERLRFNHTCSLHRPI